MSAPGALPAAEARRERGGRPMVDGEFPLTAEDFRAVAAMLHADAGIALPESKATLVYSRLAKRLRALGLRSFREYCALAAGPKGAEERRHMLTSLTTNVTRFFREPHHFDHLRRTALPPLLASARRGGRVRLWSAELQDAIGPFALAGGQGGADLYKLQALDAATQTLHGLSDFLSALASTVPAHWSCDAAGAARAVTLSDLARRLRGGSSPEASPAVGGEAGGFELFED